MRSINIAYTLGSQLRDEIYPENDRLSLFQIEKSCARVIPDICANTVKWVEGSEKFKSWI